MDLERSLISIAIREKNLQPILDARITEAFFEDDEHAMIFNWMLDYWREQGFSPTPGAIDHEFPEYKLAKAEEPYTYYLDRIRQLHRQRMLISTIEEVHDPLKAGDSEEALKILSAGIEQVHNTVADLTDEDLTDNATAWLQVYEELKRTGGLRGIPTGFHCLDEATGGLQPEQLVTLVGTPKTNKSTLLLLMAIAAHTAANRVMFLSFEMSNEEQRFRHHAFRANISYDRLVRGALQPFEHKRLAKMLRGLDAMQSFLLVHDVASTTTVSALGSKIAKDKPDLVVVDGVYLMDAEGPFDPGTPQALTSITRSMKRLAQRFEIPILQSTQALLSKYSRRRGVQMDTIGYTSSFAQDSDLVCGVEEGENPNERLLSIVGSRNTSRQKARLVIDWERGLVEELDETYDFQQAQAQESSRSRDDVD